MKNASRALAVLLCLAAFGPAVFAAPEPSSGAGILNEEQWVMLVYQKGKESYDRGDYAGATAEWDKLSAVIDRYPAFKTVIDYLRGRTKTISPESADQVEQQLAARKQQIETAFQKGKELYDQGKMNEALVEWDKLASYLPEDAAQRRLIEDLRKYYIQSQQTTQAGGISPEESAEMQRFFASAAELFKTQAEQANAALSAAENAQNSVNDSFSKARQLYYQGDYAAAMKEVDKLAPYFAENSEERKNVEALSRVYKQSLDEKGSAERALAQKSVKVKLPAEFPKFVSEVDEKFRAELKESEARRTASEKSLEDRQVWSSDDFQKGMELYREGRTLDAVRQWELVVSDFENERSVRALIDAAKKNQAELDRIRTQRENAVAERQALINGRLEKGRLLYEAGNFEEAKREWNSIKGLVSDERKLDEFLSQMQRAYQDTLNVRKAEEDAKAAALARMAVPESLSIILSSAEQKLKDRIENAKAEEAKSRQTASERETLMQKTVANGRLLVDAGKFPEALKEWASLLPIVEDERALRGTLDALQSDYEAALRAEEDARLAESKKSAKTSTPAELSTLMMEAGRRIRAQNDAASARRKQAEQSVIDRQAFVSEHFEKGKVYYGEDRHADALKEWSSLLPHLEDASKFQVLIEQAEKDQRELDSARKTALDAEARRDQKLPIPVELSKMLEQSSAKLIAETESAKSRRDAAERSYSQKQLLVQNTYDRGKSLFEEGRYSEAVKEWSAIVDEVEGSEGLRGAMKDVGQSYDATLAAQKTAEEALARAGQKLPAPAGMSSLLIELKQKITAQEQAHRSRKETAEKTLAERRVRLDEAFAKGRLAMEAGDVEAALEIWGALLPEFEEEDRLRQMISDIRAEQQVLGTTLALARAAETRQSSRIPAPAELEKALSDFFVKIKGEASLAESRRQKYDTEFEDRKTLVRNTYLKGLAQFDEGKFPEAINAWSSILGQLEEQPRLKELLEKANHDFENLALAQKAVLDAEARRLQPIKAPEELAQHMKVAVDKIKSQSADQFSQILDQEMLAANIDKETLAMGSKKFQTPSDIGTELADAREKMRTRTAEAEVKKQQAFQALADRQAMVQAEFDKGKKFYWEGKLPEAVQIWASIAPQLEDESLRAQIDALAKNYDTLLKIQKETQEAELRRDNKLKAPEEMPKLLNDMNQIVQSQKVYADTQKKIADQTYVDRQALINTTFQKGKTLYEQDRIPEALEEWASIAPYLEKGSQLKEFIDGVTKSYEDSLIAKRAADEAQLKKSIKFQTPSDLSKYLQEASSKMKAQAEDTHAQTEEAQRSRRERQIWVDGKFERGKLLYQQGDTAGAVEEWKAILPYIEDDSKVRQLILKAEENRLELEQRAAEAAAVVPPPIVLPPDIGKTLEAANAALEKDLAIQDRRRLEEDVKDVIQDKKKKSRKADAKAAARPPAMPMDEIEQMMLEYNIATPQELEKRHQELKAVK